MALDTAGLATALKNAMDAAMISAREKDTDPEVIRTTYCNSIASAMAAFVQSIDITIGPGIIEVTGISGASANEVPIVISNTPPNSIE